MTRKPINGGNHTATKASGSLRSLRSQVDKLDHQILKLVNERATRAAEVGRLLLEQGSEYFSAAREEEIISSVVQANKGPLDATAVRAIFRELLSGCRALHKLLKVAYVGAEYSLAHLAAVEKFGGSVELVRAGNIPAVFEEVNRGHADFGIVPLENSAEGRILDTLDMFLRLPQIKVCAEVRLRLHLNLLANCPQQEIRRVYGRPQALAQCRTWLSKNVPHAQLIEVASTSVAAELAQREPGAAAVAHRHAAVKYGIRILFEDVEDQPHVENRFAVIGSQPVERSGRDRTALMLQLPHQPGALADALAAFKHNKVNLGWIESFPTPDSSGKAQFFILVDFDGHVDDARIKRLIEALENVADKVVLLGSYPASEPVQ